MKPFVIYCSQTGTTEKIAKKTARDLGCPALKVEPDIVYGNFLQTVKRVISDQKKGIIPGFVTDIPDLKDYDTVFVGYPIWAGTVPGFLQEFLKGCDFAGKKVIPFATSKVTDMSASLDTLSAICEGAAVLEPFFYGVLKRDRYADWIEAVKNLPEISGEEEAEEAEEACCDEASAPAEAEAPAEPECTAEAGDFEEE